MCIEYAFYGITISTNQRIFRSDIWAKCDTKNPIARKTIGKILIACERALCVILRVLYCISSLPKRTRIIDTNIIAKSISPAKRRV